ncbi:acetyl-CoA synthetase-like protein, partial [Aspergillus fijiensis CBS 313.89]
MLQRSPAVIITILACWKARCAIVLVDPNQPVSRNGHILEDCDCALVVVDDSWTGELAPDIAWQYDFGQLRRQANACPIPPENYAGSEVDLSQDLFRPAWIRVTSGSTGRPKCCLHSHAAFGASIASYAGRIRASKTLLFFNPISSASGTPIWSFLSNGGCVCIPPLEEITTDLAGCVARYGIEDVCITPSALALTTPDAVPSLKTISLVGETVPRTLAQTWSRHVSLLIGYGATEMNSHALPFHDDSTGCLPPGHPLPTSDYSLYILQPGTARLCPLYVPGEICLSSTYMSAGYIGRSEATRQVFQPHPFPGDAGHAWIYRTGDLGMFIASGIFILLGRVDFQFKIDGNRIQPEEVEAIVNQVPYVIKSRVMLAQSAAGRPISICCVMLQQSAGSDGEQGESATAGWQEFVVAADHACSAQLPAYMRPHRWLQFETFPETPSAKTDTKAL